MFQHRKLEISFPIFAEYLATRVSIKLLIDHDDRGVGKKQRDKLKIIREYHQQLRKR